MKKLSILLYLFINCCSLLAQEKKDYAIAQKVLEQYSKADTIRLMAEPNNELIQNYLNGFRLDSVDFNNVKFKYNEQRVIKWEDKGSFSGLSSKIEIIPSYAAIPQVPLTDYKNGKTYFAMSNPAISENGKYAIIYVETFSNISGAGISEGYLIILKKVKRKWEYISAFLIGIS
jgi:hypothetical protein